MTLFVVTSAQGGPTLLSVDSFSLLADNLGCRNSLEAIASSWLTLFEWGAHYTLEVFSVNTFWKFIFWSVFFKTPSHLTLKVSSDLLCQSKLFHFPVEADAHSRDFWACVNLWFQKSVTFRLSA